MSETLDQAVAALNEKTQGQDIPGTVKFEITGEGTIILDDSGARAEDGEADVTLTADADTFQSMMDGDTNPTMAFMSGKLKIDGDMGKAMKLATIL